ncbi:MAG TPA: SBBP repeat-containing protein, partial [Pyrinomonadaceae bacterium]
LGGGSIDQGMGIALDPAGNAYVTGNTVSNDFPNVNAIQPTKRAANDAFVTKLNAAGSAFVYSTYLGGDDIDFGFGVAADSAGNAYVTGSTGSTNFPVANALQGAPGDSSDSKLDGFVTKLNPSGNAFVYSTYLGGQGSEESYAVAADSAGNAYVAGFVFMSPDFPVTNAVQCTLVEESNAFVTKLNASGSALAYSTFLGAFGTRALGVAVDSAGSAYVAGDTTSSHFPVVNPVQGAPGGFRNGPEGFVTKIADGPAPTSTIKFRQTLFQVNEDVRSVEMVVERTGDLSSAATVDYDTFGVGPTPATFIGDFTTGRGTLRFAPGQAEATVTALVSEDTYQELTEGLAVVLTNPTGGAALSCAAAGAAVQIADDDTSPQPSNNAIDDPATFVGQHYHDFLNRQADATGLNFWTSQITACGADAGCIDRARTNVSTAFALSIEFQQTGFYAFRFYKATFTDSAPRPRGMPRYLEFLRDSQELGRGVVVNQAGWEGVLEANKQEFARQWVQRPEFLARFPAGMSFDDYVAKLAANSGVTLTPTEINILFEGWSNDTEGRARTLRRVVELGSVYNRQFNAGFVLSQYIGY